MIVSTQELLNKIQENIKLVEMGNYSSNLLDEIKEDYLELVDRLKTFLISRRDEYYGYFLINMKFTVHFDCDMLAGILLDSDPPVFDSNPLLLCKLSLKEIVYIFCHEIEHVLLNHPAEFIRCNPDGDENIHKLLNISADASVNERLNNEISRDSLNFMSFPDGCIDATVFSAIFELPIIYRLENILFYYHLIENKESKNNMSQPQFIMNGKGYVGGKEYKLENEGASEGNQSGKQMKDHNWSNGKKLDSEELESRTKEFLNKIADSIPEQLRGTIKGDFFNKIKKLNEPPKIKWQSLLKKMLGTIPDGKISTRTRLNRRQPNRFDLSGVKRDKIVKIVVAIDTSGSVNNKMLQEFMNEIYAILAKRKAEITIIECDAAIQKVYIAKNSNDVDLEIKGRGGTYFTPVIEYLNENRKYRDALLIYFTDGYGESSIPEPFVYKVLWVLNNKDRYLSVKNPYGAVLMLKEE